MGITESSLMADPTRAMQVLTRLSEMGLEMVINDPGTGYSSLAYLKRLPVHEVKIDKTFVLNMEKSHNDVVIVRAIIELGHNLDLRMVAEGVEDKRTWDVLRGLGCHTAQDYHLSHPLSAPALQQWYAGWVEENALRS
jgi:EAL domain-containing protein (putative c-di-GMP-specific phosphodiesterase class I)